MIMRNIRFYSLLILATMLLFAQGEAAGQGCNPDVTPPIPICVNNTIVALDPGPTVEVWAIDLARDSYDNCTIQGDLLFSFDAAGTQPTRTYSAIGTYTEAVIITDEAGNKDSCYVLVEVVNCFLNLACNDQVDVGLDSGQSTVLRPEDIIEGGPYCQSVQLSFSSSNPDDTLLTVNWNDFFPQQVTVYDVTTGNQCWGSIVNCENDITPPVAIADQYVNVTLDPDGQFVLNPEHVDDGSFDLCSPLNLLIRRFDGPGACEEPNNPFRETVVLCCRDLGDTVLIQLLVTDQSGNTNTVISEVIPENPHMTSFDCARIYGQVYVDGNSNCLLDGGEVLASDMQVVATDGVDTYYSTLQADGYYYFYLDYGSYDIYIESPGSYWNGCPAPASVTVDVNNQEVLQDFGLTPAVSCPLMVVEVVMTRLRRCFDNTVKIEYANLGSETAFDATVIANLDPHLDIVSSTHVYTDLGGGQYEFELGDVDPFETGDISLLVYVDCDSTTIGETKCITANIYPDTICLALLPWSGANVEVIGECTADSVRFTLSNTGTADMAVSRMYSIIEDDVVLFMRSYKLNQGETKTIAVEATGATYRIIAEQEINHPYPDGVTTAFEGCIPSSGGVPSRGYITQFGFGDGEPFFDTECIEIIGSYDPNEKAASPKGYGNQNYIDPGQPISYTLYFQNTGTDTAFNIYLLDTISPMLDMATFKQGPASHPYSLDWLDGGVLRFNFDNIMLPDSFVNEPASNGFVRFTIAPRTDLPLPTVVENTVGIFFDFNDAVVTNTVFHTVDTGYYNVTTFVGDLGQEVPRLEINPNPTSDKTYVSFDGDLSPGGYLQVTDLNGKVMKTMTTKSHTTILRTADLADGLYFVRAYDGNELKAVGRLIVKKD